MKHVRISALQVRERESGEVGRVFGLSIGKLLGIYDRGMQSWRTLERSLFEDLTLCLDRLPRSGMTRNGKIYEQATWVLRTDANESGSWPTPQAEMPGAGPENGKVKNLLTGNRHSFYLTQAVEAERQKPGIITNFPAPRASEEKQGRGYLSEQVTFATPQSRDYRTGQKVRWENPNRTRNLNDQIGGQLNPTWVDALMGYMPGWTDGKMEYHVSLIKFHTE